MADAIPKDYPTEIKINDLSVKVPTELPALAPQISKNIQIPFIFRNDSKQSIKLKLKIKVHSLFDTQFIEKEKTEELTIPEDEIKEILINLNLKGNKISESFCPTKLGFFEVITENEERVGSLPTVYFTSKAHLNEMALFLLLKRLGYTPILFTKSDRPDMVLFPARKEYNLKKFLQNDELKILVETTSLDILTLSKVEDDLKNFREHTTKVLKINAKRTLIVGKNLEKNLEKNVPALLNKYHPFTIVTFDDLNYLIKECQKKADNSWRSVEKILCFDGIVKRSMINKVFE